MIIKNKLFISSFILTFGISSINAQSESKPRQKNTGAVLVTFECDSCAKRNEFKISGPENHLFIKTPFPVEQELIPGEYKMTYWQNSVQQIHLPFTVDPEIQNIIIVKD